MHLCNHRDADYKKACFDAYNRWIAEYCAADPHRLLGAGQTAVRTPEEGIADLQAIKALGLRGVMMPGNAGFERLRLADLRPVLGGRDRARACRCRSTSSRCAPEKTRGPKMAGFLSDRARLPGRHGHARARRRVRAPPERCRSCAPRPTPDGCRTSCTGWTTRTSATVTGCRPGQELSKLPWSTSPRTCS